MAKKNWIQDAVNPKHMAKRRKKHEQGGSIDFLMPMIEKFQLGKKLPPAQINSATLNWTKDQSGKTDNRYVSVSRIIDNPGTAQADTTFMLTDSNPKMNKNYYINKNNSQLKTDSIGGTSFKTLNPEAISQLKTTINNYFASPNQNLIKFKKGGRLSKDYIAEAKEKAGGSNVGNKTFANGQKRTGPYVGPSGGAPRGSYPIPDLKHAKAALALAHNAPNPEGIKQAVYRKFPELKK